MSKVVRFDKPDEYYYRLAQKNLRMDQIDEAAVIIDRMLERNPSNPQGMLLKAELELHRLSIFSAKCALTRAVLLGADADRALYVMGRILIEQRRNGRARAVLAVSKTAEAREAEEVLNVSESIEAGAPRRDKRIQRMQLLGSRALVRRDAEACVRYYRKLLTLQLASRNHMYMALALAQAGDREEALNEAERAFRQQKPYEDTCNRIMYAQVLRELDRMEEARDILRGCRPSTGTGEKIDYIESLEMFDMYEELYEYLLRVTDSDTAHPYLLHARSACAVLLDMGYDACAYGWTAIRNRFPDDEVANLCIRLLNKGEISAEMLAITPTMTDQMHERLTETIRETTGREQMEWLIRAVNGDEAAAREALACLKALGTDEAKELLRFCAARPDWPESLRAAAETAEADTRQDELHFRAACKLGYEELLKRENARSRIIIKDAVSYGIDPLTAARCWSRYHRSANVGGNNRALCAALIAVTEQLNGKRVRQAYLLSKFNITSRQFERVYRQMMKASLDAEEGDLYV